VKKGQECTKGFEPNHLYNNMIAIGYSMSNVVRPRSFEIQGSFGALKLFVQ
jgi:hypothetical protein